jgi:hypothetical protein
MKPDSLPKSALLLDHILAETDGDQILMELNRDGSLYLSLIFRDGMVKYRQRYSIDQLFMYREEIDNEIIIAFCETARQHNEKSIGR